MLQTNLARKATSNANYLQGDKDTNMRPSCDLKNAVDNAASTINYLAKGTNVDKVVTKLLSKYIPDLQQYILTQREVPEKQLYPLVMQAALLRMRDIATVSNSLGCTDYEALCQIQCDENNILAQRLPQGNEILNPQIQACLGFIMDEIVNKHTTAGGSGRVSDVLQAINDSTNYFNKADGADFSTMYGPEYYSDPTDLGMYDIIDSGDAGGDVYTPPSGPIGPAPGTGGQSYIDPASLGKQIDPNTIGVVPGGVQNEPGTGNGNGILDWLGKAISFISTGAGTVAGAASTIGNAVQGTANDVTTNAVKTAIIKNLPLIIGILVGVTLLILLIVYLAKRKSK